MMVFKFEVENCDQEDCEEEYADYIAQDNLSMEVIEVRENPVDNEDNAQKEQANDAKAGKSDHC